MLLERDLLDTARVRADFPILGREVDGRRLVYLDSAATAQKPRAVLDAVVGYYENHNANVHRGAHRLAEEATGLYEGARVWLAAFLGADPRGVVFTRNTTEAINLVARSWGDAALGPGDEIVVTEMEHHSNLVPWQMAARMTGARLRVVPVVPETGRLEMAALEAPLGARTRLVAVTHCSNVLGTVNPVAEIARLAHARGALVLVDAAQSAPHLPIDCDALGADFLALSAHKMCGPMGIGALVARPELLDAMPPFLGGGSMIEEVWADRAIWAEGPARFEAGTPNVADAVGWAAALEYLGAIGMEELHQHECELTGYALARLAALPWVRVYGPPTTERRVGVLSFNVFADGHQRPDDLIHPHDVGSVLDAHGVAVRTGHHCCQPLMRALDVPATVRASLYLYNDNSDVDALVDGLAAARELLAA